MVVEGGMKYIRHIRIYVFIRPVKNKPTRIENGTCGRSSKRGVRIIRGEVLIDGWLEEDNIL